MEKKHNVLYRQLKRCHLTESACPSTLEQWHQFLDRINRAYIDLDQERYLSERSQQISSREMESIYFELKKAESIAHLGSWTYDLKIKKLNLSEESCHVLGCNPSSAPTYEQLLDIIYSNDRSHFKELMQKATQNGIAFETELRIQVSHEKRWIQINGRPIYNPENSKEIQTLHGIIMDITERKQAQEREKKLNDRLITIARRAGMADVATSVLHNIGNILNSINVSTTILKEKLQKSKLLESVAEINTLLKKHKHDFAEFLTKNPQGQHFYEYMLLLEKTLQDDQKNSLAEIESLVGNIQHVKDVVAMQQSLGNVIGVVEAISLTEQIEDAIAITGFDSTYDIERHFEITESIVLDKVKLMQILVNLIRNAKDAIIESKKENKKIILITKKNSPESFQIQVIDNGVGVLPENITRVFSFGFTTKKSGHGFGLHTSALLAKEMGGSIKVESQGSGKGAAFTLELPYQIQKRSANE